MNLNSIPLFMKLSSHKFNQTNKSCNRTSEIVVSCKMTHSNLPSNVCISFPVAMSNIFTIPSMAPQAMYFPSGLCNKQLSHNHSVLIKHTLSNYHLFQHRQFCTFCFKVWTPWLDLIIKELHLVVIRTLADLTLHADVSVHANSSTTGSVFSISWQVSEIC